MKDCRTTCSAISVATTEDQVFAAVGAYLSSLTPKQVTLLPKGLPALGVKRAEEVAQSAVLLAHHELLVAMDAPEAAFLRDAMLVFTTAASRLAALAAT